ncbi:hypothetical protein ACHAW6_011839 [Cyclotella cf. meneghiniana]
MTDVDPTTPYHQTHEDTNNSTTDDISSTSTTLWHGLGLFGESYLLFSIGTLKPLWTTLYPSCFDERDDTVCPRPYLSYKSITYSVVSGVILGMILLGTLGNTLGRRRGSILTASLLAAGSLGMTACSLVLSSWPSILFPAMSVCLFVFGVGVGGEYPLSASSASERAMAAMRRRREREVGLHERVQRLLVDGGAGERGWQTLHANEKLGVIEECGASDLPEIPLSPTNVTRGTRNSLHSQNERLRTRGREVLMVFSMQGAGIFANSLLLTFLLMITRRRAVNDDNEVVEYYDTATLLAVWRITYATGAMILVYVLVSRINHLTESEVWAQDQERRREEQQLRSMEAYEGLVTNNNTNDGESSLILPSMSQITLGSQFDGLGSTNLDGCKIVPAVVESMVQTTNSNGLDRDANPLKVALLLQHYGVRLFGTSLTWLLWDIAFYGNKLFQSSFLIVLTGEDASLMDITGASAINAFVALLGYYVAAAIIDDPDVGRLTLQQIGFIITGTLFLLCGCLSDRLPSTWLVIIYFGSSFFGQCGPNCTTFLIPAEIFPTEMRTMCHGISASAGKLGALIASILFNFISEKHLFLFSGYASFIACCITFITIPETTTLDLYEIDKQWRLILDGRKFDYEGPANDPKHLSFYERNQNELCCRKE